MLWNDPSGHSANNASSVNFNVQLSEKYEAHDCASEQNVHAQCDRERQPKTSI